MRVPLTCAQSARSKSRRRPVDFRELGQLSGGGAGRALRAAHMARVAAVFGTSGGPRRQGHRRLSAPLSRPRRPGAAGQRPTASVRNEHSRWLAGSIVGALTPRPQPAGPGRDSTAESGDGRAEPRDQSLAHRLSHSGPRARGGPFGSALGKDAVRTSMIGQCSSRGESWAVCSSA